MKHFSNNFQKLNHGEYTQKSSARKIAIVRALPGIGDLLCCVPALRALRAANPSAEISLIALPSAQSFVDRFPNYIDQWFEFPGFPGIPEVSLCPQKVTDFLAQAQKFKFDLALQMHGNGSCTNSFVLLLGAKKSAGFCTPNHYCQNFGSFMTYPDYEPEIWRNLRLMEFLGIPLQGDHLEFPIWQSDWRELDRIAVAHNLYSRPYVCVHPGASVSDRRLSHQQFAEIADAIASQGLQIVLTGTTSELELTKAVAKSMRFSPVNLAGKTSLGVLAALLKKSRLLICNDTGVSHLASALRVNSVVIFSNSSPNRWAPLDRDLHRIVSVFSEESRKLYPELEKSGINLEASHRIIAAVVTEATSLLQREVAYAS